MTVEDTGPVKVESKAHVTLQQLSENGTPLEGQATLTNHGDLIQVFLGGTVAAAAYFKRDDLLRSLELLGE